MGMEIISPNFQASLVFIFYVLHNQAWFPW